MKTIRLQGFEERENGIHYEYDADSTPLGEGAMGCVYRGECVNDKTKERFTVAIKAIFDNIPESVVERARREAAIRVDNPYLLRMLGFIEQPFSVNSNGHVAMVTRYFVIMELLEGVTLYDMIQGKTVDAFGNQISAVKKLYDSYVEDKITTIQTIISKTLRGVKALHNEGYIHRDVDPSNIMITSNGHIKLIDFGICKKLNTLGTLDKNLTATGFFMGKVDYAAPELVIGDVDHQNQSTDIYAVGILLFQLCTGHLPFSGEDNDVLLAHMRKPVPVKELENRCIRKIVVKATQKSQSLRYEDAEAMLEAVEALDCTSNNNKSRIVFVAFAFLICIFGIAYVFWPSEYFSPQPLNSDNDVEIMNAEKDETNDTFSNIRKRLWSKDKQEVLSAFKELAEMAEKDRNPDAMFEYGLSFSIGEIPASRQAILGFTPDIERANLWLRRTIDKEPDNYRAIYWMLNNNIIKKKQKESSVIIDEIYDLLNKFESSTADKNDAVAQKYKNAIEFQKKKLKEMGYMVE